MDHKAFADGDVTTYGEVFRAATGKKEYFKVVGGKEEMIDGVRTITNGKHVVISEEEYKLAHNIK